MSPGFRLCEQCLPRELCFSGYLDRAKLNCSIHQQYDIISFRECVVNVHPDLSVEYYRVL